MITVAVVGVISSVAAPSLGDFLKNSALRGQAHNLMSSITMARSEAGKRGSRVILCRSADPDAATPTCGGSDKDWSTGWLLFVAEDTDNDFDLGTDILIGKGAAAATQTGIKSNNIGNNHLVFGPDGTLQETGSAQYAVCDDRGEAYGRQINVTLVGRANLVKGYPSSPIAACAPTG
jgi:type IV fimbrial biogenesis protein FimT